MFKAFKYRIYPSNPQKELMAKHIGSSRFVYNLALETKNVAYIGNNHNYSAFDLIKQLPDVKKELKYLYIDQQKALSKVLPLVLHQQVTILYLSFVILKKRYQVKLLLKKILLLV